MKLLVDENVDRQMTDALRQGGHDVVEAADCAPGDDDEGVLARARDEGRVLVTGDKDFGELVYRQKRASTGVLLVRLAGLAPEAKARLVASVVSQHGDALVGAFTVVSRNTVRIRRA